MKRIALSLALLLLCFNIVFAGTQRAVMDFDGDNKTDYAVVRPSGNTLNWYLQRSALGFSGQAWGASTTDVLVPGDYDGDLKWDIAVWRLTDATFYIFQSQTATLRVEPFGTTGDNPEISQDFDGDGKCDPAVSRNVGGTLTWYIQRSLLGFQAVSFGNASTDTPARGDFDGDGKADQAVYRRTMGTPANTFFVLRSTDGGIQAQNFGSAGTDFILPGDFDGDGKTDYAVWRLTLRTWYWINSSTGSLGALAFGGNGDLPVPGDYDGDGKTDQAVWRQPIATFYVNRSTLGFVGFQFGLSGDSAPAFNLQVH